mgnify:CR=1 FL=1
MTLYTNFTILTPGLLQKKYQKKRNSPGIFSGLVVFLGVFFRKFVKKIAKCNSPGVSTVLYSLYWSSEYCTIQSILVNFPVSQSTVARAIFTPTNLSEFLNIRIYFSWSFGNPESRFLLAIMPDKYIFSRMSHKL